MKQKVVKEFKSSSAALQKLEGNLLTLIDGVALPVRQSEAIKSQIRRLVWQLEREE